MDTKEFLLSKIIDTSISNRLKNILLELDCTFWFEVLKYPRFDLPKRRNCGKKSCNDVKEILSDYNIDLQLWDKICENRDAWKYFLPEYESIVNIVSITETVTWSDFSKLYSVFGSEYHVDNLSCFNFVMLSGEHLVKRNTLHKILSWDEYSGKKMPELRDRKEFERLVGEMEKLVSLHYQTECAQFVDKILLV